MVSFEGLLAIDRFPSRSAIAGICRIVDDPGSAYPILICCFSRRKVKSQSVAAGGEMGRSDGKVSFVVSVSSGIGHATAKRLASEGAAVAVVDVRQEAAGEVADEITRDGGKEDPALASQGSMAGS
jgi:hypothetical protein